MAKTCIICGEPAGSREHVFPASLGGRRTNKGIYCHDHNNGYADLAGELSEQLRAINALLGVRGDHADEPHALTIQDEASGQAISLSAGKSEFANPAIKFEASEGIERFTGRFSSEQQLQEWLDARRAEGLDIKLGSRGSLQEYHPTRGGIQLKFGGPNGLRAIAYVALTFLAHNFPEFARSPEISDFKEYTLGKLEKTCVWWDFEFPTTLPANAFEFGHRILVGLDPASRVAFARVSLFSALHFAVLFGPYVGAEAQTVMTDIDPLAEHPPNDIVETRESTAVAVVSAPAKATKSLSSAIANGRSHAMLSGLMKSISNRDLARSATAILEKLTKAGQMDEVGRATHFEQVVRSESQRVLNLMRHVVDEMKKNPGALSLAPSFEPLVAADPNADNGLTSEATLALRRAEAALALAMLDDFGKGRLNLDRLSMLIGGGPGAAIAGESMADWILAKLPT